MSPRKTYPGYHLSQPLIADREMGTAHCPGGQRLGARKSLQNPHWKLYHFDPQFRDHYQNRHEN
jgi:hypothetical protein